MNASRGALTAVVVVMLAFGCQAVFSTKRNCGSVYRSDTEALLDQTRDWVALGEFMSTEQWLEASRRIPHLEAGLLLLIDNHESYRRRETKLLRLPDGSPFIGFGGNDVPPARTVRDAPPRYSLIQALALVGSRASIPHLCRLLGGQDIYVRELAVDALGAVGSDEAVEPLCQAAQDLNQGIVRRACYALGAIGGIRARECLTGILVRTDLNAETLSIAGQVLKDLK